MLVQQNGMAASAGATPVTGMMAPPPFSPFPIGASPNALATPSMPPSPQPPRRLSEIPASPSWMPLNGTDSPARMPMLHSPASPMLFLNGQMPQVATLPVPQLSSDIANSVLKHRRDSSRSNSIATSGLETQPADVSSGLTSDEASTETAAGAPDISVEDRPVSPTDSVDSNPPLVFASIHHDADQVRAFVEAERGRRHSDRRPSATGVPELSWSTSLSASPASFSPHLQPNGAAESKIVIRSASSQGTADIDGSDGVMDEKMT